MWDEKQLDVLINAEANALWEKLRLFAPKNRLFILAEIANRVTRRLRSRESTNTQVDFTRDELPTLPDASRSIPAPKVPGLGDRATRAIRTSDLDMLRKKSKEGEDE